MKSDLIDFFKREETSWEKKKRVKVVSDKRAREIITSMSFCSSWLYSATLMTSNQNKTMPVEKTWLQCSSISFSSAP